MPTLFLLAILAGALAHHFATGAPACRRTPAPARALARRRGITSVAASPAPARGIDALVVRSVDESGLDGPPRRPFRSPFAPVDPLEKHRAVTGINAHVRWYQRFGSLVGLAVLVGFLGLLLAATMGVLFIGARIMLEVLVG